MANVSRGRLLVVTATLLAAVQVGQAPVLDATVCTEALASREGDASLPTTVFGTDRRSEA
jgi:hypothetical protein